MTPTRQSPARIGSALLAALAVAWISSAPSWGAYTVPPKKDRAVHDYAGVILREDSLAIETLAREVWGRARVAIVVVVVKSLEGETIEDLSLRWGREWGIGGSGDNRGILFLVSVGDRKARIENGYGVEGYLPDGLTGAILDQEAIPRFRDGDYSRGVRLTVARLAKETAREYGFELSGPVSPGVPKRILSGGTKLLLLLLAILLFSGGLPSALWWLLLGGRRGGRRGRRGGPPWYWGGPGGLMGGGSRGGGFGGGRIGGGGFGGFGGGSFGGGGASRGW